MTRYAQRERERERERGGERERQTDTDRQTDRNKEKEREGDRETDRETERKKDQRERERQRQRERERLRERERDGPTTNNSNGLQTVNLRLRGFHARFSFLINLTSRSVKLYSFVSTHGGQRSYSPLPPSPSIRYGLAINTRRGCSL